MRDLNREEMRAEARALPGAFTLQDVLSAIWRYKLLVLVTTLVGGGVGYWLAKGLPDRYMAEVTLISDSARSGIVDASGTSAVTIVDPSATTTVVETVAAPVVVDRALQSLPDAAIARLVETADLGPEFAANTPEERAIGLRRFVLRNLEVTNSGRSYVIGVRYASTDPETSATIANAVAAAYLGYRTDLTRAVYTQTLSNLDRELSELKADLEAADRTAQAMREQVRLVARRFETLTGKAQESAIDESAGLYARQRQAEREADATAAIYERMLLTQRDILSRLGGPATNVQLFSQAVAPTRPSGFNAKPVVLLLGIMAGLLAGASIAVLFSRLRRTGRGASA